jgi:predicted DNA-binding transcriptional regulator AlpA
MDQTPEKLISESDLLRILGLKKLELDRLRRDKGLPYVKFSQRSRAYFLSDVLEWARKNRVTSEMG